MKTQALIILLLMSSSIIFAQKNKIVFAEKISIKMQRTDSYSFFLGYEVEKDADISIDFSGATPKFWMGKTVQVSKGKGIVEVKLIPNENIPLGKGYKIIASIRDRGGDWKTTKVSSVINNIEVTKKVTPVFDDASFSTSTPFSIPSDKEYFFDIEYIASQQRKIVVAIYNKGQWIGASKPVVVEKGTGIKKVSVKLSPPLEGNAYKFILFYGSGEGFPDINIVSKEINGVEITKAEKKITVLDLREKSIVLSLNVKSELLTLPGNPSYAFIKIIAQNGQIVKEQQNTNTIKVSDLSKGGYFVITSNEDYFQFIKF